MENNYGTGADDFYWNGDGFTTELGTYNILFENTMASNNTDGGYDLKSTGTTLINAEDNFRNFRVWTDAVSLDDGPIPGTVIAHRAFDCEFACVAVNDNENELPRRHEGAPSKVLLLRADQSFEAVFPRRYGEYP
jgi:hypothetical protein